MHLHGNPGKRDPGRKTKLLLSPKWVDKIKQHLVKEGFPDHSLHSVNVWRIHSKGSTEMLKIGKVVGGDISRVTDTR
jgi:hypothetical protein